MMETNKGCGHVGSYIYLFFSSPYYSQRAYVYAKQEVEGSECDIGKIESMR